jgi:hypothetical protein
MGFAFHFRHEGATHYTCIEGNCHQWFNDKMQVWMCDCEDGYWKSVKKKPQMYCKHVRELIRRIGADDHA